MFHLQPLLDDLEASRDSLPSPKDRSELVDDVDDVLSNLIAKYSPQRGLVCSFCGEPFSDWFERTMHYDTCKSIARNRTKETN